MSYILHIGYQTTRENSEYDTLSQCRIKNINKTDTLID